MKNSSAAFLFGLFVLVSGEVFAQSQNTPSTTNGQCGNTTNGFPPCSTSSSGAPTSQVYSGKLTLSSSAAALSTGTWSPSSPTSLVNGMVCKAPGAGGTGTTNTGTVYIGPSGVTSSNGYPLAPGEAISYGPMSMANLYALDATSGDILVCTGS